MSIIVSNCQHCDEQQFQTLSCVHALHDFSVAKLGLFIRARLLDCILALEKTTRTPRVHLVSNVVALLKSHYLSNYIYIFPTTTDTIHFSILCYYMVYAGPCYVSDTYFTFFAKKKT